MGETCNKDIPICKKYESCHNLWDHFDVLDDINNVPQVGAEVVVDTSSPTISPTIAPTISPTTTTPTITPTKAQTKKKVIKIPNPSNELLNYCTDDSIQDDDGFEICKEMCQPAFKCCTKEDDIDDGDTCNKHLDICSRYIPCHKLWNQLLINDDNNNGDTTTTENKKQQQQEQQQQQQEQNNNNNKPATTEQEEMINNIKE